MACTLPLRSFAVCALLLVDQCLVRAEPIALPHPKASALPVPLPGPKPAPDPDPDPLALPGPDPDADPNAQTAYINAPYSGGTCVVGADGTAFSQAAPAICPNAAPQGCGNINVWNWCCPSANTCAWMSNNVVGCCPAGSSCGGTVNAAAVQTVTMTQYLQQTMTQYYTSIQPVVSTVTKGQPSTVINGVYVTTVSQQQTIPTTTQSNTIVYNGYCSTLVAKGPNLPTTAAGNCGTILVVSGASVTAGGWRLPLFVVTFHGLMGAIGYGGFGRRV